MKRKWIRMVLPPAVMVLLFLISWEVIALVADIEPWLLPAPTEIITAGWEARTLLGDHITQTLLETVIGFSLAIIVGIALGLLIDTSSILRRAIYPLLVFSQTIPIIAIAPVLVIWFGYGLLPKVLVVILLCFFPIVVSTVDGLSSVDPDLIALMQSMGASKHQILWKVCWPSALPSVFSGMRVSATYSVMGAVIGEWVGASKGLGVFMIRSTNSFRTDWLFAAIFISAVLSIAMFALINVLERWMLPWQRRETEEEWEEINIPDVEASGI